MPLEDLDLKRRFSYNFSESQPAPRMVVCCLKLPTLGAINIDYFSMTVFAEMIMKQKEYYFIHDG